MFCLERKENISDDIPGKIKKYFIVSASRSFLSMTKKEQMQLKKKLSRRFLIRKLENRFVRSKSNKIRILRGKDKLNISKQLFQQFSHCILRRNHYVHNLWEKGKTRLASVGILEKEREPGVGKLDWHGNIDTGFEKNILFKIPCVGFLNFFKIATVLLV